MSRAMRRFSSGSGPSGPPEPGTQGTPKLFMVRNGGDLVAHQTDGLRFGADKNETAFFDPLGKIGVLGQEAITRVNPAGVGHLGRADDRGHVEVTQLRARRPDAHAFIGKQHMLEAVVGVECTATVLMPSSLQARRMRSAISPRLGDDDFFEHGLFDDEQRLAELNRVPAHAP